MLQVVALVGTLLVGVVALALIMSQTPCSATTCATLSGNPNSI